jgi:hypothetical protein
MRRLTTHERATRCGFLLPGRRERTRLKDGDHPASAHCSWARRTEAIHLLEGCHAQERPGTNRVLSG